MNQHSSPILIGLAVCLGALASCGGNRESVGSRTGGAGGASGDSTGGKAAGSGGLDAHAGSGAGGGVGGTPAGAGSASLAGAGTTAGAGESGGAGGRAGGSASNAGQSAGGLAGEGGASSGNAGASGTSGEAGGAGASASCPTGCTDTMPVTCPAGEVGWTCSTGYDYQAFTNSGCTDLATDIQRFCCPANFFTGCIPCAELRTLDECETRIDCHSVFVDPGTCGCASPGCCAHFSACADGAWAICSAASVDCELPTPHCESPYVVSYADGCYEGCVASTDCPIH